MSMKNTMFENYYKKTYAAIHTVQSVLKTAQSVGAVLKLAIRVDQGNLTWFSNV